MQFSKTIVVSVLVSAGLFASTAQALSPTPNPSATAPSYPAWDSASTYIAGQRVTQNGAVYEAQWWTKGDSPATAGEWGAWKQVAAVATPTPTATPSTSPSISPSTSPTITPAATISPNGSAWNSSTVYTAGQRATYNGRLYEAKWYTVGENPSTSGQWGAWKDLGAIPANKAPLISNISPSQGSTLYGERWIPEYIGAQVSDPDGSIAQVEFILNGKSIGIDSTPPYGMSTIIGGNSTLVVVATDNLGLSTTASSTFYATYGTPPPTPKPTVTPSPSPSPAVTFPPIVGCATTWDSSKTYTAGNVVSLQVANGTCGVKINNYGALLGGSAQNPDGSPTTWKLLNTCAISGCPTPSATPSPTPNSPTPTPNSPTPTPNSPTPTPTATTTPGSPPRDVYLSVPTWKDDATAAYSMMHDDLCAWVTDGQIDFAAPALKQRGLVASFGMITGSCGDKHWTAAKQFIADGNEIFSHTRNHIDANSATWDAATQISGSSDDIAAHLDGYRPSFFAWPSDIAADPAMAYLRSAAGFIGGRAANRVDANGVVVYDGHGAGVNASTVADPFQIKDDMFTLTAQWSPYEAQVKAGGDLLNLHVDAAIANGGWANRTMHGVNDTSWNSVPLAQYIAHLDYLKTKVDARLLWVATPSSILKYSKAREACKPSIAGHSGGSTIVFASNNAECVRFATPITLNISGNVKSAVQAGKVLSSQPTKNNAGGFLITVDPLAGPVSFNW